MSEFNALIQLWESGQKGDIHDVHVTKVKDSVVDVVTSLTSMKNGWHSSGAPIGRVTASNNPLKVMEGVTVIIDIPVIAAARD